MKIIASDYEVLLLELPKERIVEAVLQHNADNTDINTAMVIQTVGYIQQLKETTDTATIKLRVLSCNLSHELISFVKDITGFDEDRAKSVVKYSSLFSLNNQINKKQLDSYKKRFEQLNAIIEIK